MCEFCDMHISEKEVQYGKTIELKKTASNTEIKDCQIIISHGEKPVLMIFDRFGRGAFIEISNCPMCGRKLQ